MKQPQPVPIEVRCKTCGGLCKLSTKWVHIEKPQDGHEAAVE